MEPHDVQSVVVETESEDTARQMSSPRLNRRRGSILVALGVTLGALAGFSARGTMPSSGTDQSATNAFEEAVRFTVVVQVSNDEDICWSGSGFVVGDGRHVITNAHVVPGNYGKPPYLTSRPPDPTCNQIEVGFIDTIRDEEPQWYDATLVEARETLDLSLLKISKPPTDGFPAARLDFDEPDLGSPIRVLGYPDFALDLMVLTDGIIAGFEERDYGYLYTITAKIGHGNSGGPVLSRTGKVLGVLTLGTPQTFFCQPDSEEQSQFLDCSVERTSLGYAIPIKLAQPLLDLIEVK